jgi:16S rRNA (guanine527-N7)-methyltransferase
MKSPDSVPASACGAGAGSGGPDRSRADEGTVNRADTAPAPGDPAAAGAVGSPPATAAEVFGPALPAAAEYAELLATAGVERGLIGPREAGRLWDRHILNSAVVAEAVPRGARVLDVGSGAGLPGIPVALARPDLAVTLLEPMARRCAFLTEVVTALGLGDRVEVVRGRAPDAAGLLSAGARSADPRSPAPSSPAPSSPAPSEDRRPGAARPGARSGFAGPAAAGFDVVLARALAPLDRLGAMLLPMTRVGGVMLALRGSRIDEELVSAGAELAAQGWVDVDVVRCGTARLTEPTIVLRALRGPAGPATGHPNGGEPRRARDGGRSSRRGAGPGSGRDGERRGEGRQRQAASGVRRGGGTTRDTRTGRETGRDRRAGGAAGTGHQPGAGQAGAK